MALTERPKPKTHHRKVHGRHHRHTKEYLQSYWPYLPMLLFVVLGIGINSVWAHSGHVLGASTSAQMTELVADTNAVRAQNSEPILVNNDALTKAAQAKADDMAKRDYWSHDTPDGLTPWSFMDKANYHYEIAGENLAYGFGNASDVMGGWMNSPEHRANILNSQFREIGIGVSQSENFQHKGPETIIVALYAQPASGPMGVTFQINNPRQQLPYKTVSRVNLLSSSQAVWTVIGLLVIAGAALTVLTVKHLIIWRRVLLQGENFILHHKALDITLVGIIVIAVLLTQSAGYIH